MFAIGSRLYRVYFAALIVLGGTGACTTVTASEGELQEQLAADWHRQFELLQAQLADRSWCERVSRQVAHHAALLEATDRDPADVVLRRTQVLLARLRTMPGAPEFTDESHRLEQLLRRNQEVDTENAAARYELYQQACRLRRQIAFQNPLLDFNAIVFLKKHRPMRGDHHMVDQYCGFNARPGGSVFVLSRPFSASPAIRDVLRDSVVEEGRLAGRRLTGGAFNTLDLDYDGRTILFAWTERRDPPPDADWSDQPWSAGEAKRRDRSYYYWHPTTTYHIFRADVDGSDLRQLTDGPWNDFDPVFLPDGRIVFVSERRGGFLRCGGNRPNPTYTLFGMQRDGSEITPLSFHETHEWNPSVDEDGMIVYTRWDYVDRDSDGAHHLWRCFPDGSNPRSPHGNYPRRRELRPWMELSIRAIPGSRKYVAVAAPHHGYNYGSLVLIDPTVPDDGATSQVRRLTPEAHFPESEQAPGLPHAKGTHDPPGEVYGTPWPLSEEFYLCVYDADQRNYGIYLIDCFGNRELIWRDDSIACLDPIPLRSRTRPPVLPTRAVHHRADDGSKGSGTATVGVVDVYRSRDDWPNGVRIRALRVVQVFPKTTYHQHQPEVSFARQSLARGVLGVVPVEEDGSALFEIPAGKPVYFQLLDEQGQAVQSMRTVTYFHRGEKVTCIGCHEAASRSPTTLDEVPLAFRRPPSQLAKEPEGSYPLAFPRLVQPVLDRRCVSCHEREKALDLSAVPSGRNGWSKGYASLARYAWGLSGGNGTAFAEGMRSIPGRVGARASRLMEILDGGHHGVTLTPEERRRITVWLDCNSNFFGAYHDLEAQAAGERVGPLLE